MYYWVNTLTLSDSMNNGAVCILGKHRFQFREYWSSMHSWVNIVFSSVNIGAVCILG